MKHLKPYKLFENKNQETIDEFFSVMQGTPEGTDFMKWFVADPKRTGRIYITTIRGTGVYMPSIIHFNKESNGNWSYRYVSSGNEYGHQYGDLKWLFRRMIIDGIIKSIPPGVKKAEIEEFFTKNPITPGTLPDKLQPLIDFFIQSERGGLVTNMYFLKDLPWIKTVSNTRTYNVVERDNMLIVNYNRYNINGVLGISSDLENFLSELGIRFNSLSSITSIRFIPGKKGKKRQKKDSQLIWDTKYDFYLGYETEGEIKAIAEKEINKCLDDLICLVEKQENWSNKEPISFMRENLESLIKNGTALPDYEGKFNRYIADLIGDRIKKDYSKLVFLKDYPGILEILREKNPDIFGKSEEATKDIIKGASVLKRFGSFGED